MQDSQTTQPAVQEKSLAERAQEKAKIAIQKVQSQGSFKGLKTTEVQAVLEQYKTQMAQALPSHLTPERMLQMTVNMLNRNPKLAECNAASLIGGVMQASILGFSPVEALGECYFVPYKDEIQFQIGYKGYISLARRSGLISTLYAEVVYKDDEFNYELGLDRILRHKPNLDVEPEDKNITFVYAVALYKDGSKSFVVLSRKQIEALRRRSPSQKNGMSGAWATDYAAMAKAKAIKQLSKWMPLSVEQQAAFMSDNQIITPDKLDLKDKNGLKLEEVDTSLYYEVMKDDASVTVDTETGEVTEVNEAPAEENFMKNPETKAKGGK